MALPDYLRVADATAKTIKSSGGEANISLASVANGAARQSTILDFGATRPELQSVQTEFELAATPTAGSTVDIYFAPSHDGSTLPGGCSGSDAAYSGYSSNLAASLKHLIYVGSHVCTTQATTTVQKAFVGVFRPPTRYGAFVVVDNSGVAFHSTNTNQLIRLVPVVGAIEDT